MKNQSDGGKALVEAFRKLGVEYILSSPGTEWAPVWEAIEKHHNDATLAANLE